MSDDNKEGAGVPVGWQVRGIGREDGPGEWRHADSADLEAYRNGPDMWELRPVFATPPAVMPAAPSDAVRGLGRRLAELLDEDHWAECEPLLLGIETAPRALVAKWRHAAEHLGLEGLASLSDCADELEAALSQPTTVQRAEPAPASDTADAARWRFAMNWGTKDFAVCYRDENAWVPIKTNGPIDTAIEIAQTTALPGGNGEGES